ncbi:hypothetical protein C3K47_01590 [Solitalea longa]|uniref:OmpA-like domain-containing protein n=1 Tax=Solitalea longa TaxID=2079460 RepID=A0A2S5AAT1_9SPHI|nr:OmpA family protein [Solitalea longa]POY39213.1 hypothetical protein C3K47_01590 [Solitalea longa]
MKKPFFALALLASSIAAQGQSNGFSSNSLQNPNDKNTQVADLTRKKSTDLSLVENFEPQANTVSIAPPVTNFQSYLKFDFLSGDRVIAFEDFSQDKTGTFPLDWNTNGVGEIATLDNQTGKWLSMGQIANYRPEFMTADLPENFSFEFDLVLNAGKNTGGFYVQLGHAALNKDIEPTNWGAEFRMVGGGEGYISIENFCYSDDCKKLAPFANSAEVHFNSAGEKIRVSISRMKQRLKIYINEVKVIDEFKLLDATAPMNCINFKVAANANNKFAYVSNIKLTAGIPDVRKKLMVEDKFVTSGVLFDPNSDMIRPESYPVLKEIASVLKENPSVKIKIVGHSDAETTDLDLAKRRAESIKNAFQIEFGINESRMQTEGANSASTENSANPTDDKSNTLLAEFIKLPK